MSDFERVDYTEADLGCMLFESITKGLYDKPLHAIREYVQNELEANPTPTRINVELEGDRLSILGDGGGMDESELAKARRVGISEKTPLTNFGFRGIGIWSGVSLAETLLISTKKLGMRKKLLLRINADGIMQDVENLSQKTLIQMLSDHTEQKTIPGNQEEYGTHVQLIGLFDEIMEEFDEDSVKKYLCMVLPIALDSNYAYRTKVEEMTRRYVPNYRVVDVFFNGQQIFRPPNIADLEEPEFRAISIPKRKGRRKENLAYIWSCLHKDRRQIEEPDCRRLVYKQHNFTVGNRNSVETFYDELGHLSDWYVGEIHITSPNIIANSARMGFEPTTEFRALEKGLREYFSTLERGARTKSHVDRLIEELADVPDLIQDSMTLTSFDEKIKWIHRKEKLRKKLDLKKRHRDTPLERKKEIVEAIARIEECYEQVKKAISMESRAAVDQVDLITTADISTENSTCLETEKSMEMDTSTTGISEDSNQEYEAASLKNGIPMGMQSDTLCRTLEIIDRIIDEILSDQNKLLIELKICILNALKEEYHKLGILE